MLFHDSRRNTRTNAEGDIVLLEDQDRELWNRFAIHEGVQLLAAALGNGAAYTRYGLEAQIASVHATASSAQDTDWPRIVALYKQLKRVAPSPVVELNEAVAIAMVNGPEAGIRRLWELQRSGQLENYHLLFAAQARLLEQMGRWNDAAEHYGRALALARNDPERRFIGKRLAAAERNASR
jgi:RNA polymerase sigma-70 factor (ECF subfamily)